MRPLFFALVALGAPASPTLSDPVAVEALAQAKAAFASGDYDAAAAALERAYEAEQDPKLLVAWAQAVRLGGDCPRALELYREYLDGPRTPQEIADTRKLMAECPEPESPPPAAVPEPVEPQPEPEPEPKPESVEREPIVGDQPEPPQDDPVRPWSRNPAGIALAASAGVVLGTATGLLIAARVSDANADGEGDHTAFRDRLDRAITMERVSIGLYAGGAALAVGAAVTFGIAARRNRRTTMSLAPHPGGLSISGRF